ncbi:MAG TPA: hypothetical protein VM124_00090 [Candidatus Limnocylindrales bacterium]|nr:hypothetical protein [Candidatus Limnocylindrales bacterium]
MKTNNHTSSWRIRQPAVTKEDTSYLDLSQAERLTTYTAGDPLCGYRGLGDWHEKLLNEEFATRSLPATIGQEAIRGLANEQAIADASGSVVAEAELILITNEATSV